MKLERTNKRMRGEKAHEVEISRESRQMNKLERRVKEWIRYASPAPDSSVGGIDMGNPETPNEALPACLLVH